MLEGVLLGGRYKLGPAIGAGGSGTVFRARDQRAAIDVAVKLVPPGFDAERLGARLRREASILRRIASRHVARILDSGEDVPGTWLAMELVEGTALSPEALGRPLFPHEVLRVARGLLEGLAATHEAGILHGDVKPVNVLVPRGGETLDAVKLVDFGIASMREDDPRGARFALEAVAPLPPGEVLGTARYLAPEALLGRPLDPRADVYATGLVLFELLAQGTLFGTGSLNEELRARLAAEPQLEGRVPSPLASVLAKMLARDPAKRYADAAAVLSVIVDLDTAPVSTAAVASLPPPSLRPMRSPPPPPSLPSLTAPRVPTIGGPPSSSRVPLGRPSITAPHITALPSLRPGAPLPRLTALADSPESALVDTLRHLDLAMLDALARRERGSAVGRVARALALTLRLELDAAALVLEPLVATNEIARAVGVSVLGPRARRVTRVRVGDGRDEPWGAGVPAELRALLVALGAAIGRSSDAPRDVVRLGRAIDGLSEESASHATLRMSLLAARARAGELDPATALDAALPLGAGRPESASLLPLDRALRSIAIAKLALEIDAARAREELERAHRIASETGAVLLEVVAAIAWATLLLDKNGHVAHGLALLERAATLVAHGDTPTLEHAAHHHRATALLARGEWAGAVACLHLAREAARAERAVDAEVSSIATELVAHLAAGSGQAREVALSLSDTLVAASGPTPSAFAWLARALAALVAGELDACATAVAAGRASAQRAPEASGEALVLLEAVTLLAAAGRGPGKESVETLERLATTHRFGAFHWADVLRAVVSHAAGAARPAMLEVFERIAQVLGRSGSVARERPTSAPPPPLA